MSSTSENKGNRRRPIVLAGVIAVAVIMVMSMLLPSLSAIFTPEASKEQPQTSSSTEAASTSASTSSNSTIQQLDDTYSGAVAALEATLKDKPEDQAALLNAGNDCLNWGAQVTQSASADADKAHGKEILTKAVDYYDRYLKLADANAVHVNRALAQYYLGQKDEALKALEDFTAKVGDFAPAWANLGMMYQASSQNDKAKDAFTKALGSDPDNKYGMKEYAQGQLDSIAKSEVASTQPATTSTPDLGAALKSGASASGN